MVERGGLLFTETQRFRQTWIWISILGTDLLVLCLMGYALYQQLAQGKCFGNNPTSDKGLVVTAVLVVMLMAAITWLFHRTALCTEVRPDGLCIRYYPFHLSWRKIPLEKVTTCEAVTYRPMGDYGGWGIRWGRAGRAYNVYGNRGVRLTYENGRSLLIGSQKPEELAEAIESVRSAEG